MSKYVNPGDSIEGNKSNIIVRKISKPQPIEVDGIRYYKYKSKLRSIVKITEELNPKIYRICCDSNLNLNDEIDAQAVLILITVRIIRWNITSNFSHKHGIQNNSVNDFTYAKIVIPWRLFAERAIDNINPHILI